jgi:hypothetical protein
VSSDTTKDSCSSEMSAACVSSDTTKELIVFMIGHRGLCGGSEFRILIGQRTQQTQDTRMTT